MAPLARARRPVPVSSRHPVAFTITNNKKKNEPGGNNMFNWYREITPVERKTFWTCFAGWALDALDVQMFGLVIAALIAPWHVSNTEAGLISAVTLITSALGGWVGGALAYRYGRVRALQITILWFSIATFLSAFAQSFGQLLVLKGFQGF